jgi:hypothetical protein
MRGQANAIAARLTATDEPDSLAAHEAAVGCGGCWRESGNVSFERMRVSPDGPFWKDIARDANACAAQGHPAPPTGWFKNPNPEFKPI